jgi:hypothetical protein
MTDKINELINDYAAALLEVEKLKTMPLETDDSIRVEIKNKVSITLEALLSGIYQIPLIFVVDTNSNPVVTKNTTAELPGKIKLFLSQDGVYIPAFTNCDEWQEYKKIFCQSSTAVALYPSEYIPMLKEMEYDIISFKPTHGDFVIFVRKNKFEEYLSEKLNSQNPEQDHGAKQYRLDKE